MSDVKNANSNYIRFFLKAPDVDSLQLHSEPIGWREDEIGLKRDKKYHGIFNVFTGNLKFTKEAKEYIETAYRTGGVNTDLFLTKEVLTDNGTDVVWEVRYKILADFNKMYTQDNTLVIPFNSNNLETLIKSHETDDFELEREDSIDGDLLDKMSINKVTLEGRSILEIGESKLKEIIFQSFYGYTLINYNFNSIRAQYLTFETEIVSEGIERHVSVGNVVAEPINADNLFYVNSTNNALADTTLNVNYSIDYDVQSFENDSAKIKILKVSLNGSGGYNIDEVFLIKDIGINTALETVTADGSIETTLTWNQGLLLAFENVFVTIGRKQQIKLTEVEHFESSVNLDFVFTHDLISRLMYILTANSTSFYSKYFGRTELGYTEDGYGGLIGNISGFWARAFVKGSDKYKSLKISLKDALESCKNTFNLGVGIETIGFDERLRVEDLRYFYQNEVVVRLPFQISKEKRSVDSSLFFSGLEFGYDKAGDYEESQGLDEPNTKTSRITPIRKSTKKFSKISKIRADEYGLELARRKPQLEFPNEDTKYDDGVWFLDLKRTDGEAYAQKDPLERLDELPTGIHSPETFRSAIFTPLRMLMRHAWIFTAGLQSYINKSVKYISTDKNSNLVTYLTGDIKKRGESEDITITELDRPLFLAETLEFEHPVDDNLIRWIQGTTRIKINGSYENIPNFYFKFEYLNENDVLERGFLLEMKPKGNGKFKMQVANENII